MHHKSYPKTAYAWMGQRLRLAHLEKQLWAGERWQLKKKVSVSTQAANFELTYLLVLANLTFLPTHYFSPLYLYLIIHKCRHKILYSPIQSNLHTRKTSDSCNQYFF